MAKKTFSKDDESQLILARISNLNAKFNIIAEHIKGIRIPDMQEKGNKLSAIDSHKSVHSFTFDVSDIIKRIFERCKRGMVWNYTSNGVAKITRRDLAFSNDDLSISIHNIKSKTIFSRLKEFVKPGSTLRFVGMVNDQFCDITINIHSDNVSKSAKKPSKKVTKTGVSK